MKVSKEEKWKDVAEYEGFYQVSNKGNVRSVDRTHALGRKRRGRILKPFYNNCGYLQVSLSKNGTVKIKSVHRLVAEEFVLNPENLPQVNHIDEGKDNNNAENLEWCDSKYNINYGTRNERMAQAKSKKVRAVSDKTGDVIIFSSTQEVGRKGYDQSSVAKACKGVYKTKTGKLMGGDGRTYKGFKWYYEEEK